MTAVAPARRRRSRQSTRRRTTGARLAVPPAAAEPDRAVIALVVPGAHRARGDLRRRCWPRTTRTRASADDVLARPGAEHLLGADGSGRDILSRLLYAARFSLAGALLAVVVAAVIGITAGLIAGYYGKWFEASPPGWPALLMALPGIVVLLAARVGARALDVDVHGRSSA